MVSGYTQTTKVRYHHSLDQHDQQTCSAHRLAVTSRSLSTAADLSVPFARALTRAVVLVRRSGLARQGVCCWPAPRCPSRVCTSLAQMEIEIQLLQNTISSLQTQDACGVTTSSLAVVPRRRLTRIRTFSAMCTNAGGLEVSFRGEQQSVSAQGRSQVQHKAR